MNKALYLLFLSGVIMQFHAVDVVIDAGAVAEYKPYVRCHFEDITVQKELFHSAKFLDPFLTKRGAKRLPSIKTQKGTFVIDYDKSNAQVNLIRPAVGIARLVSFLPSVHRKDTLLMPQSAATLTFEIKEDGDISMKTSKLKHKSSVLR